jgi:hypothetical protein
LDECLDAVVPGHSGWEFDTVGALSRACPVDLMSVPPPIPEPIDHLRERRPDRRSAGPRVSRKTRTIAGGGDLRS